MKFLDLSEKDSQLINGGGLVLAGVGAIIGAFTGCVAAGINAVVNDDYSTRSLTQSIAAFTTAGAGIGLVIPAP